jgi:hypothetical protein
VTWTAAGGFSFVGAFGITGALSATSITGYAIGTNVQAYDADLTTYAGITPSANIQSFLGSADYATARTNLGVAIGSNVQEYDADLTTWAGISPSVNVQSFSAAADYSTMRTLLGVAVGSDVQAYDAELAAVAGLTFADDYFILGTGAGTIGTASCTTFAQSILDDANESTFKATVNLEAGVDYQAYDADLTTWSGITPSANVQSFSATADYGAMRALLSSDATGATWDPASLAYGDWESKDVTITGAALGDFVLASPGVDVSDLVYSCAVTAASTATITLANTQTASAGVDLASSTWKVLWFDSTP